MVIKSVVAYIKLIIIQKKKIEAVIPKRPIGKTDTTSPYFRRTSNHILAHAFFDDSLTDAF